MARARNSRRRHDAAQYLANGADGRESEGNRSAGAVSIDFKELLADVDCDGVRIEKLARAHQLAADPDYPSAEVVEAVADLLAKHLQPGSDD